MKYLLVWWKDGEVHVIKPCELRSANIMKEIAVKEGWSALITQFRPTCFIHDVHNEFGFRDEEA